MDANGHRFWLLADGRDFDLSDAALAWCPAATKRLEQQEISPNDAKPQQDEQ